MDRAARRVQLILETRNELTALIKRHRQHFDGIEAFPQEPGYVAAHKERVIEEFRKIVDRASDDFRSLAALEELIAVFEECLEQFED